MQFPGSSGIVVWVAIALNGAGCGDTPLVLPWTIDDARPHESRSADSEPAVNAAPRAPEIRFQGFEDHRKEIAAILMEVGPRQLPMILPSTLVVTAQADSQLRVTNLGTRSHTFSIDALGVYRTIRPGESVAIALPGIEPNALYELRLIDPGEAAALMSETVPEDDGERGELPEVTAGTTPTEATSQEAARPPWPPEAVAGQAPVVLESGPTPPQPQAPARIQGTLVVLSVQTADSIPALDLPVSGSPAVEDQDQGAATDLR